MSIVGVTRWPQLVSEIVHPNYKWTIILLTLLFGTELNYSSLNYISHINFSLVPSNPHETAWKSP